MKWLIISALFTLMLACGGGADTTAPDTSGGNYELVAVDNAPLPFTVFSNSAGSDLIVSGEIDLNAASRTYTRSLDHRAGAQSIRVSGFGAYSVAGGQIRFDSRGGDSAEFLWPGSGSISAGAITYQIDGHSYRFQR